MKMTDWFPAEVKPVRVGYYQRDYGSENTFHPDYWDGSKWHYTLRNGETYATVPYFSNLRWRGLAEPPK